jgi:hypothetical protein
LRAPFCSASRVGRGDDRSALPSQKRPCACAVDPKTTKISAAKIAKQASRGSKTIQKRVDLTKFDRILSNLDVLSFSSEMRRF